MSCTINKRRKVMNCLANGGSLTANEAKSRFGVGNLRATISSIKSQVETYGNWEIIPTVTATGLTRYFMEDTHPGNRTYGFDNHGHRFAL